MAIEKKRMQQRYGTYDQFQKENLLPHEFASVTSGDPNTSDGKGLYFGYGSGDVKRIAFSDEETDPTVPAWAKEPTKPTYTADEVGARPNTWMPSAEDVGALPNDTEIPSKTSDLENDSGFVTNSDIPKKLPNPQKIIFTGAVTAEYDGSTEQTVNIPESTGGDSYTLPIMSDTQLGGGKAVSKTDEDVPVAVDPGTGQLFVPTYPESTGGSADIPRQEMQNTDTTVTLEPNKLYVFPEMASLTVTLGTPINTNVANEYHFFFTSGATATTLTLNDVLSDAYSIEANMKYEVSILDGVAYIKGVSISAETQSDERI